MPEDTAGTGKEESLKSESQSAEAKREARRKRILQNSEKRLQRILGPNSEVAAHRIACSSPDPPPDEDPVLPEEFLTFDFLQKAKTSKPKPGFEKNSGSFASKASGGVPAQSPFWKNHRNYVAILGALLPFFGLNYIIIYFILLEVGVVTLMREIPTPPSPPNILFTLVLIMGLKEEDINRIKLVMRIAGWIFNDACLFIIAGIIPQILIDLVLAQGQLSKILLTNS